MSQNLTKQKQKQPTKPELRRRISDLQHEVFYLAGAADDGNASRRTEFEALLAQLDDSIGLRRLPLRLRLDLDEFRLRL